MRALEYEYSQTVVDMLTQYFYSLRLRLMTPCVHNVASVNGNPYALLALVKQDARRDCLGPIVTLRALLTRDGDKMCSRTFALQLTEPRHQPLYNIYTHNIVS